jgi:sorting nexin-8
MPPAAPVGGNLQAWVTEVLSKPLQITVTEPKSMGSYLQKHHTYLVCTAGHGYAVRRRFSEFEWLLNSLTARFCGLLLPSLPEKKVHKKDDEAFVRSRMRGLNIFMDQLTQNAFLRSDPSLLSFVSIADSSQWDAAKKSGSQAGAPNEPLSIGQTKWREALEHIPVPENAERVVLDVKQQLEPMGKLLSILADTTKKLADKTAIYAAEMVEMKSAFSHWKLHEEACGDPAKVEYANKDFTSLNTVMTHTENMYNSWQEILSFQPSINELLLHENIKFQYQQVLQMKGMLKQREDLKAALIKAEKLKEKHEVEQQGAAARGKADKVAKLEKEIQQDRQNVMLCQQRCNWMTKGLFFSELDRYSQEKNRLLREAMGQMSAAHFQYAKRLGMMWQGYINALEVNPQDMMEKARVVFAQAAKADAMDDAEGE